VYAVAEGVATDSAGSMYPMYLYKSTITARRGP
jgi:hypothetical protein